ncbi:alpha/beta hydrolase, partial [Actinomyces sp. 186855]
RRAWDPALDLQELTATGPDGTRAVRVVVATSPGARRALAAGRSVPALLWVHGGGHVLGDADADAEVYRHLADELGAVAVSVDYRTAFRAPHPADVDDCWAVLTWLLDGGLGGVDPRRVAVVGESAGGGTAASLVQRAVDHGIHLAAQVLIYPMLDDRAAARARDASAPGTRGRLLWSRSLDRLGWAVYLRGPGGTGPGSARPYAVPGRRTDLAGTPPTWVGVGDLDLFHDDDVAYAGRLRRAGVECELVVMPGMYHAADRVAPQAPVIRAWRRSMLAHLRHHLVVPDGPSA